MRSLVAIVLTGIPFFALSQAHRPCCTTHPSNQMALLSNGPTFLNAHLTPLPTSATTGGGSFITFKTGDTLDGRAFEVKSPEPSDKVIFMFHEWWGLNDYIQQEAVRLQKELGDVTVLAIDLYDGKVAKTQDEAGALTRTVTVDRAGKIIKGALEHAGANARVGTIGWCFGGAWSLQAALILEKQTAACVVYYGMPETDVEKLKTLNSPVLGIFAKQDGWITPEKVTEFEKAMKEAGKKVTVKMYDAVHAFANPSNPKHDKKAAEDAWKHTIRFLKKQLG